MDDSEEDEEEEQQDLNEGGSDLVMVGDDLGFLKEMIFLGLIDLRSFMVIIVLGRRAKKRN